MGWDPSPVSCPGAQVLPALEALGEPPTRAAARQPSPRTTEGGETRQLAGRRGSRAEAAKQVQGDRVVKKGGICEGVIQTQT